MPAPLGIVISHDFLLESYKPLISDHSLVTFNLKIIISESELTTIMKEQLRKEKRKRKLGNEIMLESRKERQAKERENN